MNDPEVATESIETEEEMPPEHSSVDSPVEEPDDSEEELKLPLAVYLSVKEEPEEESEEVAAYCCNTEEGSSVSPKKAAPLSTCTASEQRSVVRFLNCDGVKPVEIHRRMQAQYGDSCLPLHEVYEWCIKFKSGVPFVEDTPRPRLGRRVIHSNENIAAVEELVKENRRINVKDIATILDISVGTAHNILHDVLRFSKVSTRWVPRQLTAELRDRRVDACEELLRRFQDEGDGFLERVVTGDETWVHYHQPDTKRSSDISSPKPKKFRAQSSSAGKVMLTLFWDADGVILEHYKERGVTVSSTSYADLLQNHLRPAIKSKRRRLLTSGVLLQHDNARPHTSRLTVATIQDMKLECLTHPPYSPDLAPSDFHVFGRLKEAMEDKHFQSDEDVKATVHEWLHSQPKEFFSRGIHALPKRWNTCITRHGDYVEV